MSEPRKFRLTSTQLFHTPGLMRYAECAFRTGRSRKERDWAINMLVEGYSLPRFVAWGLLDGCIPYTVRDAGVEFVVSTAPTYLEPKAKAPKPPLTVDDLGVLLVRWDEGDHEYVADLLSDASPAI